MKILVTIKRTPQRDVRVKVGADGAPELAAVPFEVNPFDELAVEEALRIREARGAEVVVVSVGGEECHEQILAALAMGADRAVRVEPPAGEPLDSLQIARLLRAVVDREGPELVLCGKLAVDDENAQVPAMLAALCDWPQASQVSSIEIDEGGVSAACACEVDGGLEFVEVDLPAVVTADLRLNEPRYASLPGILKAKKKPIEVLSAAACGDGNSGAAGEVSVRTLEYRAAPTRAQGVIVESARALADALAERI